TTRLGRTRSACGARGEPGAGGSRSTVLRGRRLAAEQSVALHLKQFLGRVSLLGALDLGLGLTAGARAGRGRAPCLDRRPLGRRDLWERASWADRLATLAFAAR